MSAKACLAYLCFSLFWLSSPAFLNAQEWSFSKKNSFSDLLEGIDQALPRAKQKRAKRYFDAYTSQDKQFIYFRIFKAATGTLTHFFAAQVDDMSSSRFYRIPKELKSYFKFAFVRNSWERILSCYVHKVLTEDDPAFAECFGKDFEFFVDYIERQDLSKANRHIALQTRLFPYKQCDFIGRIDHFEEDLSHICSLLGLEMESIGHRHQTEHRHYSTYYTPRMQKIIAEKYKEEIQAFAFTFEKKD